MKFGGKPSCLQNIFYKFNYNYVTTLLTRMVGKMNNYFNKLLSKIVSSQKMGENEKKLKPINFSHRLLKFNNHVRQP
jgi:hypothetical protein